MQQSSRTRVFGIEVDIERSYRPRLGNEALTESRVHTGALGASLFPRLNDDMAYVVLSVRN